MRLFEFMCEDYGSTAIEYSLLASLIAVVVIVAVGAIGLSVNGMFELVSDCFD